MIYCWQHIDQDIRAIPAHSRHMLHPAAWSCSQYTQEIFSFNVKQARNPLLVHAPSKATWEFHQAKFLVKSKWQAWPARDMSLRLVMMCTQNVAYPCNTSHIYILRPQCANSASNGVYLSGQLSDVYLLDMHISLFISHSTLFPCSFHFLYYPSSVECKLNMEMWLSSSW